MAAAPSSSFVALSLGLCCWEDHGKVRNACCVVRHAEPRIGLDASRKGALGAVHTSTALPQRVSSSTPSAHLAAPALLQLSVHRQRTGSSAAQVNGEPAVSRPESSGAGRVSQHHRKARCGWCRVEAQPHTQGWQNLREGFRQSKVPAEAWDGTLPAACSHRCRHSLRIQNAELSRIAAGPHQVGLGRQRLALDAHEQQRMLLGSWRGSMQMFEAAGACMHVASTTSTSTGWCAEDWAAPRLGGSPCRSCAQQPCRAACAAGA